MMFFSRQPMKSESEATRGEAWWRDFAWEEYAVKDTYAPISTPLTAQPLKPLKCECCGAPMKTPYKCEYCGTNYGTPLPKIAPPTDQQELTRRKLEELKDRIAEVKIRVAEAQLQRSAQQTAITRDQNIMPTYFKEVLDA